MAPIARAGLGWLLVVFDLRLGGYDVVVDAAGWLVVLLAMLAMRPRNHWFTWAARAAAVAMVLSLIEYLPDLPGAWVLLTAYNLVFAATLFCQASGMTACASAGGADGVATQTNGLRWAVLALNVLGVTAIISYYAGAREAASGVAVLVFLSLVCFVWFTALQLLVGNRPYFEPDAARTA